MEIFRYLCFKYFFLHKSYVDLFKLLTDTKTFVFVHEMQNIDFSIFSSNSNIPLTHSVSGNTKAARSILTAFDVPYKKKTVC